jgi:hypothetical protein
MKRRKLNKAVVLIKLLPLLGLGFSATVFADDASNYCNPLDLKAGLCSNSPAQTSASAASNASSAPAGDAKPISDFGAAAAANPPAPNAVVSDSVTTGQSAAVQAPTGQAPAQPPVQANNNSQQAQNPDAGRPSGDDLSLAELKATFPYFSTSVTGHDPNQEAVLNGTVFADCAQDFTITNSMTDPSNPDLTQAGKLGFKVSDPGGKGRACMKTHRHDACSASLPCGYLTSDPNAHMKLSGSVADSDIGIISRDPMAPPGVITFDDFATHHSAETIKAQKDAEKKASDAALLSQTKKIIAGCHQTQGDIDYASDQVELFCEMVSLDQKDCDAMRKSLNGEELPMLTAQAKSVKLSDTDSINDLSNALTNFANANPDQSDKVAIVFANLANRLVSDKNATDDSFAEARLLVDNATQLPSLSDAVTQKLAAYPMQIDMLQLQKKAQSGNIDQSTFMPAYENLMKQAYQNVQSSCQMSSMSMGMTGLPAGCSSAIQMMNKIQQIPQQYTQAVQQQYMFQAQVNQAIYSAQGQISSPMMGANGMMNSGYGYNSMATNPYLMQQSSMPSQYVGGTAISAPTWR